MHRPKLLLTAMALLVLAWIGFWIHGWWGTITLDYENQPLATVLRSFTRQSDLPVITDLDQTKSVTIHVVRVPVAEALDAVQALTESRGRLAFVAAPSKLELEKALGQLPRKLDQEKWKTIEYRLPYMFANAREELPRWADPRKQLWNPSPKQEKTLTSLFDNAAQCADIRIILSANWNPGVQKLPSPSSIASNLIFLTRQAGGMGKIVFLLSGPRPDGYANSDSLDRSRPGDSGLRRSEGNPLPPEAFACRLQSLTFGLPEEQSKETQASIDDSVRQYKEWLHLSPEEQEKKIQEIMQDPNRQARGSDRFTRGMRMMSPEQRAQRYARYNARKEAVKDPGHSR